MRQARFLVRGLGAVLATAALGSTGCTHNYYYTTPAPCGPATVVPAPATSVGTVRYGEVCEVPTQVVGGSTTIVGMPSTASPVLNRPAPRVVLSEPNRRARDAWRPIDSENSMVTTRVEGALDDPTLRR